MEEERKKQAAQAKKRKEREDRERELRQQKENERLERLKKQQEEEHRRKEEEKKRKAEEKAAKSKALREAKEREEKEKQEQNKKLQANKRLPTNGQQYQPQYQQQQQQKYPREVPPRFLRQMQQRQTPTQSEEVPPKDSVPVREEADWDDDDPNTSQTATDTNNKWTDNANVTNENWGKELSNGTGSLSDWGTANITEDWDAPSESSFSTNWTEQKSGGVGVSNDQPVLGTIGSEMKSGKIPKKDSFFGMTDQTSSGQYGAIGEPMLKEPLNEGNTVKDFGVEKEKIKEPLYKDVIGVSTVNEVKEELSVNNAGSKYVNANTLHGSKTSSPKLTGWSGLDGFEPLPSLDSSSVDPQPSQSGSVLVDSNTKMKVEQQNAGTISRTIDPDITVKEPYNDGGMEKSTTEKGPIRSLETGRGTDDWGWTTASSKKTKQKPTTSLTATKDTNVWVNRSLKQLLDMGFKLEDAERALKENKGIIESAVSDLLSRTDTTPNDAKVQEQKRKQETVKGNEPREPEVKLSSKIVQTSETSVATDISNPSKIVQVPSSNPEFPTSTSVTDVLSQTKSIDPRQPNTFLPPDLIQGFPDNTHKVTPKPVGVIGGQLTSSSPKPQSQSSPRPLDESVKVLAGPTQPPASSLHQTPLHHIATPGSQIPSSSLHQTSFSSFGSNPQSLTSQSSSRIHQIMHQKQIPQARPGDTSHNLPSSLFQQPSILTSVSGAAVAAPKEQGFIPTPLQNSAPLQSKLLQWTQAVSMEPNEPTSSTVGKVDRENTRAGTKTTPDVTSTSAAPVTAPVTVDPVSAKWGVIAAPRLSPTPSEFKPGVQWKPKAELERDDKKSSQADDEAKESTELEKDTNIVQDVNVNGPLPASDRLPSAGIIRPPPGLSSMGAFDTLSRTVDPQVGKMEHKLEQGTTKQAPKQWLSLSGWKQMIDYNSIRLFCQQYGTIHMLKLTQGTVFVCYDNPTQASTAYKAINGKTIFDSIIVASFVSEEDALRSPEAKLGLPQQQPKPFIHNQFSSIQPRPFWDQNGQIGTLNPPMNPNLQFAPPPPPPQPMAGMPPGGLLGLGPHHGQWPRTDPLVNHSPYWPMTMQPQGLLNQVPGYGSWPTNTAQVTAMNVSSAHNTVSPSTGTRLLPDGLFNATESI